MQISTVPSSCELSVLEQKLLSLWMYYLSLRCEPAMTGRAAALNRECVRSTLVRHVMRFLVCRKPTTRWAQTLGS